MTFLTEDEITINYNIREIEALFIYEEELPFNYFHYSATIHTNADHCCLKAGFYMVVLDLVWKIIEFYICCTYVAPGRDNVQPK